MKCAANKSEAQKRNHVWLILAVCAVIYFGFTQLNLDGLSLEGKKAIAFTICVVILLLVDTLPLLIISNLVIIGVPILGIATNPQVFSNFAIGPVFFVIGVFILAEGFTRTGFGYRVSLYVSGLLGSKPQQVVLSYILVSGLVSSVLADIPTAIIFGALALEVLKDNDCHPGTSNFGKMLMIGVPIGATIGGLGTPAGGVVNVLTISLVETILGIKITFLQWTAICFPFAMVMLVVAWAVLCLVYKPEIKEVKGLDNIKQKRIELGPMTMAEKKYLIIFAIMLVLWMTSSIHGLTLWAVAILGTTLFFMPGINILNWPEVKGSINFEIPFLIGAMNVVAFTMTSTGAAEWMAKFIIDLTGNMTLIPVLVIVSAIGIYAHYIFPAASGEVMVLTPVVCMIGAQLGIDPVLLSLAIGLTAHCSMLLPLGDTICLATYGYGFWGVWDMLKPALILSVIWIPITVVTLWLVNIIGVF